MVRVRTNPITRRVGILSNQWLEFAADDDARLLWWGLASDEIRMFDAFLELELDERTAEHSDLFVTLESAFDSADAHAATLRDELIALYDRERAPLQAEGMDAAWAAPEPGADERGLDALVRTCTSLASHYALPRHLVLVLRPRSLGAVDAYKTWLLELTSVAPRALRFIVVDSTAENASALAESSEGRLWIRDAALDMPGAYAEISQNARQPNAPGSRFRDKFLQFGAALGSDLARAENIGAALLGIAQAQGWFHMAVPIHVALGGALAAAGRADDARAQYVAAEQSALRGQTEGQPQARKTCRQLRMQSRLGFGAALMAGKEYREGAQVFEATIPLAVESGDNLVELDCHRLASLCLELAEANEEAFQRAQAGLSAAKRMSRETLCMSTLPFFGEALLRLLEPTGREAQRAGFERELAALTAEPPEADAPQPAAAVTA